MFEVTTKQLRRCDVVRVKGRVDSATAPELKAHLDAVMESGQYKIVLNLSDVTFMSSAGLRQLIDALKTCKRWNRGNLILAEATDQLKEVLDLAGLTELFTMYDDETDAVGSF